LIAKALGVDQNTAVRLILIKGLREIMKFIENKITLHKETQYGRNR